MLSLSGTGQKCKPTFYSTVIHPLFTKLATQPGLFVEHAGAYAELAGAEVRAYGASWQRRATLTAIASLCALLALLLTGVAVMLAASLPLSQMPAPWLLWAVPAGVWMLCLACAALAWRTRVQPVFNGLRDQWAADVALFHEAENP